jgi:hypothetical protein
MSGSRIAFLAVLAALFGSEVSAQAPVVWDGGNGTWNSANWNGGQLLGAITGDGRGTAGGHAISIGGGSQVIYDSGIIRDLRLRINNGPASLTIKEGALLSVDSNNSDQDGVWTQFDGDLILDNGTYRRTHSGSSEGGGLNMFGSWRSLQDQKITVNVRNGGRIENTGQIWFGADEEHALGLKVHMNVNNGTLQFIDGDYATSNNSNIVVADLAFFYGSDQGIGNGAIADGAPKGEDYRINFKGPGSMRVDANGIWVYDQDSGGNWTSGLKSYQDLWDRGILRSHGMSGLSQADDGGIDFNNFFTVAGTPGTNNYQLTAKVGTTVTWDGGNGEWTDAKWNGGQTAQTAFGRTNGAENAQNAVIGGGAQVLYRAGNPGVNSDFRLKSVLGPTSVTIKEGASLELNSTDTDVDGKWTQMDGDLILDNGTFKRTFSAGVSGSTVSGGIVLFGSWRSVNGQEVDVTIKNGGRFINDGQVGFGAGSDQASDIGVTFTINRGTVDLTGGDNYDINDYDGIPDNGVCEGDLNFYYAEVPLTGEPKNEQYVINFTGPGTFTVDHSGIYVHTIDDIDPPVCTAQTYQQLWTRGILQANGKSGLSGDAFGDFFTVAGTLGTDNYTLTSLLGGPRCDFDSNGNCNIADIDALVMHVAANGGPNATFDLNGDNAVNLSDVNEWRALAGAENIGAGRSYLVGDANLDGNVDGTDFGIWNSNKFTATGKWSKGDFNADGNSDGSDFGLWNSNKFTSSDSGSVIPEPTSIAWCGLGLALLAWRRRK